MDLRDLGRLIALAPGQEPADPLTALLAGRPSWHSDAACRGVGTELFFPARGGDVRAAKAICETCPVVAECAEAGQDETHGVWGGTTANERRPARAA